MKGGHLAVVEMGWVGVEKKGVQAKIDRALGRALTDS